MSRRGLTIVELLVATVLAGIVLGAFTNSLISQRRAESTLASNARVAAVADEAVRVVTAALARVSDGDTLWVRGDTALEWRATIGVALACVASGDSLVVPAAGAAAWWEHAPDSGDAADVVGADGAWSTHEVVSVRARSAGGPCGGAERTLRVRPSSERAGTAMVRVTRRVRFTLYRGGDGAWWLGERRCPYGGAVRCSSAQPVAGPLIGPPVGLRFAVDTTGDQRTIQVRATSGSVQRTGSVAVRP